LFVLKKRTKKEKKEKEKEICWGGWPPRLA
jgi:hypothetical protein